MSKKKQEPADPSAALIPTVTQGTLDSTPKRVLPFLVGIGTVPAIRTSMENVGYTEVEHKKGWSLFLAATGYTPTNGFFAPESDQTVRKAIAEIDANDEDIFRVVRASLTRLHPAQASVVLAGLEASTGAQSVVGMAMLLERLAVLGKSKNKEDHAALKTLAERGFDEAKQKHFGGLVNIAREGALGLAEPDPNEAKKVAARQAALVELRAWYTDWAEMAKTVVKRRDRLIRLGLARRKSPTPAEAAPPPAALPPAKPAAIPSPS